MIQVQGGRSIDLGPTGVEPHVAALLISEPDGDNLALLLTMDDLDRLILDAHALRHSLLENR